MGWYAVADAREGPVWGTLVWLAAASLLPLAVVVVGGAARRRGVSGYELVLEVSVAMIGVALLLAVGLALLSALATGL